MAYLDTRNPVAAPVVDDLWNLPRLIAWLETMPADGVYDYFNCHGGCLTGQYAVAHGRFAGGSYVSAFAAFGDRIHKIAAAVPYTFGAALDRARRLSVQP